MLEIFGPLNIKLEMSCNRKKNGWLVSLIYLKSSIKHQLNMGPFFLLNVH